MSKKNRLVETSLVASGDMSADIEGSVLDMRRLEGCAIQALWTGTSPVGTIKIQGSCDKVSDGNSGSEATNWTDIDNSSQAVSGATGGYLWNGSSIYFSFIRPVFTFTSGVGTLNVRATGKGI